MAIHSLLALLDDITVMLDDIAVMTKVAAKKTAGVLGDDLALNAQQVGGVRAEREWPVVWAVAKGSFWNKCILVPAALLLAWKAKFLITPLLMIGGAYLCFEGVEKIAHKFLHKHDEEGAEAVAHEAKLDAAMLNQEVDLVAVEKDKIKGAIRTDFILSAEIIVIALGTLAAGLSMGMKAAVLTAVAIAMTVGVYGLVALIVKIDDAGIYLLQKGDGLAHKLGKGLLRLAPLLMKTLAFVGTLAMFLVGGGIVAHGLPSLHHAIVHYADIAGQMQPLGGLWRGLAEQIMNLGVGLVVGSIVLAVVEVVKKMLPRKAPAAH